MRFISLDQAAKVFEHGVDFFFTDSVNSIELDASLKIPDAVALPVSSGFLCSVSAFSGSSKQKHTHCIKSCKLGCQVTVLLLPI